MQTSCEKNECLTKQKTGSVTKASKHPETVMITKNLSKGPCNKDDAFIMQKDNTSSKPDNIRNSVKKPLASNKKFKKQSLSVEDLRDNLVCLTQEQLEQILMAVKEGTQGATQVLDEKKGETSKIFIFSTQFTGILRGKAHSCLHLSIANQERQSKANKQKVVYKFTW